MLSGSEEGESRAGISFSEMSHPYSPNRSEMWERTRVGVDGESHPQELNRVIISLYVSKCHLSPSSTETATMSSGSFVPLREGHRAPWGVGGRAAGKLTPRSKESSLSSLWG